MPQAGTGWKCAAVMRESFAHPSKYTKLTLPSCRESPLSSEGGGIAALRVDPCYTSFITRPAGLCADASLGTASAQTSHDCRGLVCVWWRPWVSGRAAPRPQYKYSASRIEKSRRRQARQGMIAGLRPVGSTGTKLCGHTVSTAC